MRVLIVDDEPAARAKLRRLLAGEADVAELLEASDAPSALALVHALAVPPDLALLDIEMPGGSGVQLASALRQAGVRAVVFSTAHAEHALQAFELAALDYLLKPCTAERLAAALVRVRELLARPLAPVGEWWVDGERLRLVKFLAYGWSSRRSAPAIRAQVRLRAERLGLGQAPVELASETNVEDIVATLSAGRPPARREPGAGSSGCANGSRSSAALCFSLWLSG